MTSRFLCDFEALVCYCSRHLLQTPQQKNIIECLLKFEFYLVAFAIYNQPICNNVFEQVTLFRLDNEICFHIFKKKYG